MSLALLAGASRRQRLAAALFQYSVYPAAAATRTAQRLLSSNPSDEFNREMAAFFGALPGSEEPQRGGAGAAASASRQPVGSSTSEQMLSDVHDFNAELSGVLAAAAGQLKDGDASAGTAASLARQLTAAGVSATGPQATAAADQPFPSSSNNEAGHSSYTSFASSSSGSSSSGGGGSSDGGGSRLTHVDAGGKAAMVDVSHKRDTVRTAAAAARVVLGRRVFELVAGNQLAKGDVLTVAQLAGVMGAKHTASLIPLCHNILLSKVHVALALVPEAAAVDVRAEATTVGPTGVEMEALMAAAVAALTVYDMCKAASKGVVITNLRLLAKSGGKSGDWAAGGGGGSEA